MTAKRAVGITVAALIALGMFPVVSTQPGADAVAHVQSFLELYSGVFTLLAFTATVVWGLIAADRIVPARHRILAQALHRMLGMVGLGLLGTHIVLQILAERAGILDAVIPFMDTRARLVATGLGTIASDLLIVVFAIGMVRGRFAASSRPWVWRVLHGIAYLAWPIAIVHGLTAGRAPAGWVTTSYAVCLVAVLLAFVLRLISPFPAMRAARRRLRNEFAGLTGERSRRGDRRRPDPRPPREPATQPLRQVSADTGRPPRDRTRSVPPERPHTPERRQPPERAPRERVPRERPRPREPQPAAASAVPRGRVQPLAAAARATPATPGIRPPDRTPTAQPEQPERRERPQRPVRDEGLEPAEGRPFWRRQRRRERPLITPDLEEVEFWAALRAETAVWIRRGRR
jgi:predicted membrane protein